MSEWNSCLTAPSGALPSSDEEQKRHENEPNAWLASALSVMFPWLTGIIISALVAVYFHLRGGEGETAKLLADLTRSGAGLRQREDASIIY